MLPPGGRTVARRSMQQPSATLTGWQFKRCASVPTPRAASMPRLLASRRGPPTAAHVGTRRELPR
eukprot:7794813-Alexandrium_andersonii.AAC.1